jgi:hypothetical protein
MFFLGWNRAKVLDGLCVVGQRRAERRNRRACRQHDQSVGTALTAVGDLQQEETRARGLERGMYGG